jgi:hypothetical protein
MIYFVGGVKGGVGKSLAAMALVHQLGYENVCVAETDNGNPDVYKALDGKVLACQAFNIREQDGWLDLVDFIGENAGSPVVINTGAANNETVDLYGDYLLDISKDVNKPICVIWLMNQAKDGVLLLNKFLLKIGHENVAYNVVLNTNCNSNAPFEEWEASKTKATINKNGGGVFFFDTLANRCKEDFYNQRLSFAESLQDKSFGKRIELERWLKHTKEWMDKLVVPA